MNLIPSDKEVHEQCMNALGAFPFGIVADFLTGSIPFYQEIALLSSDLEKQFLPV